MRTVRVILNNGNKKIKFNYDQNVQNINNRNQMKFIDKKYKDDLGRKNYFADFVGHLFHYSFLFFWMVCSRFKR